MTLAGVSAALLLTPAEPAHAALIKNVPEWAQNVFGVLYLAFFGAFLLRVFNKRAKFATSTKLADDQKATAAEDDGASLLVVRLVVVVCSKWGRRKAAAGGWPG